MKILYLTNIPAPYRVEYFNQLSQKCDLTVLYEKAQSDERDEKWRNSSVSSYKSVYLKGIKIDDDKALSFQVVSHLKKDYDYIIICGVATPTVILAILWCQLFRIPYCIEGDGAVPASCGRIKWLIKKILLSKAKICFSTGKYHDEYYLSYGVNKDRIKRYYFSSIKSEEIVDSKTITENKLFYKCELGIKEDTIILAVGQFIHRKGFDTLIQAARKVPKEVGIYFVGGIPTEEYKKLVAENGLTNIHFEGFKNKEELELFYRAADIFVLPTREDIWGLVVEEAMARCLPVITTYQCASGVELVKNGENGFLFYADDECALTNAVRILLDNDELRRNAGELSRRIIERYTIESMVDSHIRVFESEGQT